MRYLLLTSLIAANSAIATENGGDISEKIILGWIENIYLQPYGLKAKTWPPTSRAKYAENLLSITWRTGQPPPRKHLAMKTARVTLMCRSGSLSLRR